MPTFRSSVGRQAIVNTAAITRRKFHGQQREDRWPWLRIRLPNDSFHVETRPELCPRRSRGAYYNGRLMKRALFTILSALSLLLFVAVVVMWARSYRNNWFGDQIQIQLGQHRWELVSQGGGLTLCRMEGPWFFSGPSTGGKIVPRYNASKVLGVPHWACVVAAGVLPITWCFRARSSRRRRSRGLCLHCGYDLRATPDRCPECGAAPAKAPA